MKINRFSLIFIISLICFSPFSSNTFVFGATLPPIFNDGVLSQHIKEADGTSGQDTNSGSGVKTGHIQDGAVTTNKIADETVTTPKITDGAVTDEKITGPISGSKLGSHTHSGADIVDGTITNSKIATEAITPDKIGFYRNVIIVAPSGGDFTNPVDAVNAITDASETNPYLVKIMPGIYNVGLYVLQMKSYVDIVGSGENITRIIGTSASGVIRGASNAEIRFLTVEAGCENGSLAMAIRNDYISPKISHITIIASCEGRSYGIYNETSTPLIRNVDIKVSGNSDFSVGIMNRMAATIYSPIIITDATITVTDKTNANGIYNATSVTPVIMTNVITNASGGSYSYGIYNYSSAAEMINVKTLASGAGNNYGVYNSYNSTPNPSIMNVIASAKGGAFNCGISNFSLGYSSTVRIDHSVISGSTATICSDSNATTYVGDTKLDGGPVANNGGIVTKTVISKDT
ncbi:MAG: hypothetical protein AB1632_07135 [Nitrospirota bacterium]